MKVSRGTSETDISLEFDSPEEYESFFEESEKNGFFSLDQLESLPKDCVIRASAVGSPRSRKVRPVAVTGKRVWLITPPAEEVSQTTVGESLFDQIRKLPVSERVNLAMKADLPERRILMQENNPKINEFLLRNVRITESEIAWLARNASSPLSTILAIANHSSWMGMEPIRTGILCNPKTPPQMLHQLIPNLAGGDLMKMHQSRYLREDLQLAVEREMKRRGMKIIRKGSE